MAKSKLVKANEKITEKVVGTFGKIENSVVGSYTKIEDAFVDSYLTNDGETVEEAKKRLKQSQPSLTIRHSPEPGSADLPGLAENQTFSTGIHISL